MSEAYLYICHSRKRAVKSTADEFENWKIARGDAMTARDVEDWVRECLRISEGTIHEYVVVFERLRSSQFQADPEVFGESLRALFDATLLLFGAVADAVTDRVAAGYVIDNSGAFGLAQANLLHARATLLNTWPWRNPRSWQCTAAQISSGEFQFASDILHELQVPEP